MAVGTECDLDTDKATGSDQRVTRAGGVSANQPIPLAAITKAERYYERMKKSKDNAGRRIKVVSAVCLAFMIIEFTGKTTLIVYSRSWLVWCYFGYPSEKRLETAW